MSSVVKGQQVVKCGPILEWGYFLRLWLQSHINVRVMLAHCLQRFTNMRPTLGLNISTTLGDYACMSDRCRVHKNCADVSQICDLR